MSQTYISQIVVLLGVVLPSLGVKLGDDQLTIAVQGVMIVGGIFWTLVRRFQVGDITLLGVRKPV